MGRADRILDLARRVEALVTDAEHPASARLVRLASFRDDTRVDATCRIDLHRRARPETAWDDDGPHRLARRIVNVDARVAEVAHGEAAIRQEIQTHRLLQLTGTAARPTDVLHMLTVRIVFAHRERLPIQHVHRTCRVDRHAHYATKGVFVGAFQLANAHFLLHRYGIAPQGRSIGASEDRVADRVVLHGGAAGADIAAAARADGRDQQRVANGIHYSIQLHRFIRVTGSALHLR